MGKWLAEYLIQTGKLPREKVHAVGGGTNIDASKVDDSQKEGNKFLFVGRDFKRKGGDSVCKAFDLLQKNDFPEAELYVAGPKDKPAECDLNDHMVIMLQHGKHQAGNYTKHQYPLKGKVYCGYCQKLMKYRVLKKLGPSFNCRFSATAVDSPCKRIPIAEELLEEIVRNALTAQIKQAEHILEILHERERKALICFSALERQEEKLSAEKAEIVKQRVALYEQYADGNMSKEEFIRQRDAYRAQEDERMGQIQRLRTEKNQIFLPVKKDTDNLQAMMNTVGEAGDVMHLSQNVVETFIDRIEVFNDERVKIHFTFEDTLKSYETG